VIDTSGPLLTVMVTAANATGREAARVLLARPAGRFFLLRLVWADRTNVVTGLHALDVVT
jgi:hypothetical protein